MLTAIPLKAQDRIADVVVDEDSGETAIANLDEAFADLNENLAFEFFDAPREINMSVDDDNVLRIIPADDYNIPDGVDITIVAVLPDGEAVEDVFNLIITPLNDEPVVVNAIDDIEVDENADLTSIADLEAVFFDVDRDELSFSFSGAPEEVNMNINDNNILQVHPEQDFIDNDGSDITVRAEDPDGESVEVVFNLIILEEGRIWPPWIDNIRVDEDPGRVDIADLDVIFVGWERDIQEFRFEGDPDEVNLAIEDDSYILFFHPDDNFNLNNGANITVTALDEEGESVDLTFRLSIRKINDLPVVSAAIDDVTVNENSGERIIADLDDVFSDVEDEQLIFWFGGDSGGVNMRLDDDNILSINPHQDYNLPNGVDITVTAADSADASVEDVFRLIVNELPSIITYYLYFGTYIPDEGAWETIRITPIGDNIAEGETYVIPDYDLAPYNLGESFQTYMDAISGTTLQIEEGGIGEDIEIHLIMNNLIVADGQGGEQLELTGIWSPDEELQNRLWMFAEFQVWTTDEDSVQLNEEEDFEFFNENRMVVNVPLDNEFRDMMVDLGLEYDSLGAGIWMSAEGDWSLNGIVSEEVEIGEESWFQIGLSQLSNLGGGPWGGFGELEVPNEKFIPRGYFLSNAYPNPFNRVTRVDFGLREAGEVNISLYDVSGHLVRTLINGNKLAGRHSVTWDAVDNASGVYILQIKAGGFTVVHKVALVK